MPGTADQTPTPPSEVNAEPAATETPATEPAATQPTATEPSTEQPAGEQQPTAPANEPAASGTADGTQDGQAPLLPRRTPGANEMPGKPIEQTDSGGGWFTKGSDKS